MCFHSQQSKTAQQLEHRYNAKIENPSLFQVQEQINGFTFPKNPVIANTNPDMIQHYSWGLIPFWAKDNKIRNYTLNAKIETIGEKPSYRKCMDNRCLIIADGFFEWKWLDPKGKKKQKYLITLPDNALFALGGIWSEWVDKSTGEVVNSYSVVTTEANGLMSEIHNTKKRMPVILTEQNEKEWLNGSSFEDFKKMEVDLMAKEI